MPRGWLWGCLLCGVLLTACDLSAPAPPEPPAIRMGLAQMPLTLDPRFATDAASERVNRLIYRSLVDFDTHSKPIPALADWQVLSPLHYRFTLKDHDRRFHDGTRLTSADIVATYRSLMTASGSPHRAEFANIRDMQAPDDDTVDFYLHRPDTDFVARLIVGILPARLIEQKHDFSRHPIGSGPMRIESWRDTLRLKRIADGQTIELLEVKDPTVRVLKLRRGEIDLLQGDLPPELVGYLQQQPEIRVLSVPGTNFSYLGFNLRDPVLQDIRVRQAIAHAIDRKTIAQHALVRDTRLAGAILPPEHWAGNAALEEYAYNPDKTRQLLIAAGVQLPLKLVYKTSTDAQRVRLATVMQAQMAQAGIQLEIRSLDWGTFFDDVKHGKFQLYGLTWVGIKTPEIYRHAFHSASVPPVGANRGQLRNAALDRLIDAADWPGVTRTVNELLPYVPLWYEGQFAAMRRGLTGFAPARDGNWDALAHVSRNTE